MAGSTRFVGTGVVGTGVVGAVGVGAVALGAGACAAGGAPSQPPFVRGARHVDVEIPQFEIHADNVDRFATCPPQGGMTQGWIPPVPPWSAPKGVVAAPTSTQAVDAGPSFFGDAAPPPEGEINLGRSSADPMNAPSPAEKAIRDTLQPFRACHRRALRHDQTQSGHVAVVVRVGADGKVVRTESHGACDLSREAIACMLQTAARLRFDPPADGNATIIIPAVFAPRGGIVRAVPGQHDDYAAAVAVTVETGRAELHACDERERRAVRPRSGWGNFIIDLDETGRAARQNIEPYDGNQELLRCASDVVGRLKFPAPPGGTATVRVRIEFNPSASVSQ